MLLETFRDLGLRRGDVVFVHSDLGLAFELSGADCYDDASEFLLCALEDAVGTRGTIVVPTFTYSFCEKKAFDTQTSDSEVGKFTNYVRRFGVRSFHGVFSCAAVGHHAEHLCGNVPRDAFGFDGVFQRLHANNAHILFFDTSFERCTFIHYVEQFLHLPYRETKYFSGMANGWATAFSFYARKDMADVVDLSKLEVVLRASGKLREQNRVLAVRCEDVFDAIEDNVGIDPMFLYRRGNV